MEEWKEYNITQLCDSISYTFNKSVDKVVLVNTSDVLEGKLLNHELTENKNLRGQFKKSFKKNDILYSEIRPANKRFAFVDIDPQNYIASTKLMVLRNKDIILPKYLYYLLTNNNTINILHKIAVSRSGTFPQITFSELSNIEVKLPSLDVQNKILSIISSLDDKIENNRKINENLEQQAQALFKSWFVDFEPFRGKPFVDSELGMIPQGWKVGKLGDICEIVGGGTPSKKREDFYTNSGIAWLTPKDLSITHAKFTSKGENDITKIGYDNSSAKLMPRGSVLFSSRAPIGYITIAQNDICTNQGFKSAVPKIAGTAFLYNFLKRSIPIIESQATGSTFKEASGSLMKSLDVVIPPKDVFDEFEKLSNSFFKLQESLESESKKISKLRDSLLPKLMFGEIKV